mgnify:CR=1 FL=1
MRIRKEMTNTVYIGYDSREHTAYEVLKFSIERIATKGVRVVPIKKDVVSRMGLYTRKSNSMGGQSFDEIDGRPFSTDFSFTRFLVPHLNMYQGKALYNYYPLWCVKHKYEPPKGTKMDGKVQEPYARKNWSSLMMFNCSHHYNEKLTVDAINTQTGRWLHTFQWLPDKEADIGTLPEEWNWLDGHSNEKL